MSWFDDNLGKVRLTPDPPFGIDGQCVNAASSFSMSMGGPELRGATAWVIFQSFRHPFFDVLPTDKVQPGDIVFFFPNNAAAGTGDAGHVNICVSVYSGGFVGADTDWNGSPKLEYVKHGLGGVAGVFRKKGGTMNKDQATAFVLNAYLLSGEQGATKEQYDYHVPHVMADPGYAAALLQQLYQGGTWQNMAYKAGHYDADVKAAQSGEGTVLAPGTYTVKS